MYRYEWIAIVPMRKGDIGGHFRISDKKDNAVAFCYTEENAAFIVRALNHYTVNGTV